MKLQASLMGKRLCG